MQTKLFSAARKSIISYIISCDQSAFSFENVNYSFFQNDYGLGVIASTNKGICSIEFGESESELIDLIKKRFAARVIRNCSTEEHKNAIDFINKDSGVRFSLRLHLKGTEFQIKVWKKLTKIKSGHTSTYERIAAKLRDKNGARAVGSAVGKNPVAILIPCHRVVQKSGGLGGFKWGIEMKRKLLNQELIA